MLKNFLLIAISLIALLLIDCSGSYRQRSSYQKAKVTISLISGKDTTIIANQDDIFTDYKSNTIVIFNLKGEEGRYTYSKVVISNLSD